MSNSLNRTPKTWSQLKGIVEYSRKAIYLLNSNVPANITFREYVNSETGKKEYRIYFLAGELQREITIKYLTVNLDANENILVGNTVFLPNYLQGPSDKKLTKEEQLLRERKRCSFSGITQYTLGNTGRLVFSERSELFSFDDEISLEKSDRPTEIKTSSKGSIDVKICPINHDLISYVLEDNLWIQDLKTKQETKLTSTFEPFKSGVPSYAVQEEFNRYSGYWWHPNKQINADNSVTYRIIYEETDETDVDLLYITPSCVGESGYDTYRYPKAGTPNSKVYLKMVEFTVSSSSNEPVIIHRKTMHKNFYQLFNWFEYLTRAEFTPDGKNFWVQIYDRLQYRKAELLVPLDYFIIENNENVEMKTSSCETPNVYCILEQSAEIWINAHNSMYFLNDKSGNNMISFINASDETGFLHLYHYKISLENENLTQLSDGVLKCISAEKIQLTSGDWCIDADDSLKVDQENHLVYFTAYVDPKEAQFFVVDYLNPLKMKQLTSSGFTHHVSMNEQANLYVTICSNLKTPFAAYIYQINNQGQGLEKLTVNQVAQMIGREDKHSIFEHDLSYSHFLINNVFNLESDFFFNESEKSFVEKLFRPPQMFEFFTPDNCKLYGMIYMPFNYVEGEKYPTLLYVYGGPRAQLVTNSYKTNKFSRLNVLSLLNYCVVVVDSRGSDNRGVAFEAYLKHRMGTVEIDDQVKGLEAASKQFNCIDQQRIAIFGWSYGGYMSLMGLAQRPDVFKVAISGAPVTLWGLYDTAYTERYMSLPEENKKGYNDGSVVSLAKSFPEQENRLLIIHGMIDENVHFAHTRQLIDALIKENKPYQLQIYPNERHGIRSPDASIHCDTNFFSFLERYL